VGQVVGVLVALDEGDVARLRLTEGAGGVQDQVGVAARLPVDQFRQLPQGDSHAPTSFLR
jgi:hypothetical protein